MSWPFGGESRSAPSWPDAWEDMRGTQQAANRAQYLAPVFAAIRHIVDYGSSLPLNTYREQGDGSRRPTSRPQLFARLDGPGRPGSNVWIGQALHAIATRGNAVGWVNEYDGFGFPTSVTWLRHTMWAWDDYTKRWSVGGQPVDASRIVHVPWIVPEGCVLGLSPIEHFATLIGAGLSAQEYANIGRGGGAPPAILTNARRILKRKEAAAARQSLEASLAGGRPWVTGADWKLEMVTIPPNHLQFLETLKLTATQTAAIYGLDPREVGGAAAESLTYSNDESRALNRAANMRPYLERLEHAFSRLLPNKQLVEFDIESTIRTDMKTRTEILAVQVDKKLRSRNEARVVLGLEKVPGGDAFEPSNPARSPQPPDTGGMQ